MSNGERVLVVVWTLLWCSPAFVRAQENPTAAPRQDLEIRRKFAELSRKVNESPEIRHLKAEVEKAQKAYTEAFEAALAKEDSEIMAKYRGLFESRIERLQGRRLEMLPALVAGETNCPTRTAGGWRMPSGRRGSWRPRGAAKMDHLEWRRTGEGQGGISGGLASGHH